MKLFVGLGNPGARYAGNRHNIGAMAIDRIAERHAFSSWRRRFQGETAEGGLSGERVVLLRPETYMNESGRAVGEAARYLKIDPADVVVFHDELDLAPGQVKAKLGGGNAGHNGLRSITAHLGNDYVRVRLGIGHPGHKDAVSAFVLSDFSKADRDWLEPVLDAVAVAAPRLAAGDLPRFLSEVAVAMRQAGAPDRGPPARPIVERGAPGPKAPSHPAGERIAKRQGALAENIRRWLSRRTDR